MGGGAVFLPLGPKEPGWLDLGLSQKDSGGGGCLLRVLPMWKRNKENRLSLIQGNKTEGECLTLTIKIVLLTDKLAFFKLVNI